MRLATRTIICLIRVRYILFAVCVVTLLIGGACGGDNAATPTPAVTQPPSGIQSPPPTASPSTAPAPTATVEGTVRAMQLVTETEGWVLNDEGLWFTTDGGQTWADITPDGIGVSPTSTGLPPNFLSAVTFIDGEDGWLSVRGPEDGLGGFDLMVDVTEDGGQSWRTVRVADASANSGLSPISHLEFLDADHGWIVWEATTSSAFSGGVLYRTDDGGETWGKLTIPLGEPVSFANENDGFVVGGQGGGQAFATHDGGESWEPLELPVPDDHGMDRVVTVSPPTFLADGRGVLPVTFVGEGPAVGYFVTEDSGRTWSLSSVIGVTDDIGIGVAAPSDVVAPSTVSFVSRRGRMLLSTRELGSDWAVVPLSGLPGDIINIDFVDRSSGWAMVGSTGCTSFKSDCWVVGEVLKTSNGGWSWAPLSPGLACARRGLWLPLVRR